MSDAKTIQFARCGRLAMLAHGSSPPTQKEWDEYVAWLGEAHRTGVTGLLVLTDGPGPNSYQRKMISGFEFLGAVLTPSPVARGIVTALGWFGVKIRAFPPDLVDDALGYLGVEATEKLDALRVLAGLRLELAGKQSATAERMLASELHGIIGSSLDALAKR